MALPATHIRFAATIVDRLAVSDMAVYLSGTLYPDSRWVTGFDRRLTHDRSCLDPEFPSDDYTLGWHIHCACDRIQATLYAGLLEGPSKMDPEAWWYRISAAKVVQDINDASQMDIGDHIAKLRHSRTPNGESGEAVAAYLAYVRDTYSRTIPPGWADYVRLWTRVGWDRRRIYRIERQVDQILMDKALVFSLYGIFDRMVNQWTDPSTKIGCLGGDYPCRG
jgi:hypothetical protein